MFYPIHHYTKIAFGLLKRPRDSGINPARRSFGAGGTSPAHLPAGGRQAFIYSVAILDFIDQKLAMLHNKFSNT